MLARWDGPRAREQEKQAMSWATGTDEARSLHSQIR